MAVKTITIDLDAYNLLVAERRDSESFSRVIKRKFRQVPTADDVLKGLDKFALDESTLGRLDEIVRARRSSPVRPVRLSERRT